MARNEECSMSCVAKEVRPVFVHWLSCILTRTICTSTIQSIHAIIDLTLLLLPLSRIIIVPTDVEHDSVRSRLSSVRTNY